MLAIFASACVAAYEAVARLINPQDVTHLGALPAAGAVGFIGNWLAASIRNRWLTHLVDSVQGRRGERRMGAEVARERVEVDLAPERLGA